MNDNEREAYLYVKNTLDGIVSIAFNGSEHDKVIAEKVREYYNERNEDWKAFCRVKDDVKT